MNHLAVNVTKLPGPPILGKTQVLPQGARSLSVNDQFFDVLKELCENGHLSKAIWTVDLMDTQGFQISTSMFYFILQGCIAKKSLEAGRALHRLLVRSGYESNTFLGTHLIRMFTLCGSLPEANQVFSKLPAPSVFTWSAIITAHAKFGQGEEAIKLYNQMQISNVLPDGHAFVAVLKACTNTAMLSQGKLIHAHIIEIGLESDVFVRNTLIDMYAKCGSLDDARRVFDRLPQWDVVAWDAMLAGYIHHGQGNDALQLFQQMQYSVAIPNKITYLCVLKACSSTGSLPQGKLIYANIIEGGFEVDLSVGNSLIDMYSKCGALKDAHGVFDRLPMRDIVTWGALIAGHVQHKHGQECFQLFQQMQQEGILPDVISFSCILKECSNLAALSQGNLFHAEIIESGFESNIFVGNSLIDMYTKCGSHKDAQIVFDRLPERDVVTWNMLIEGFIQNGLGLEALKLFQQMQRKGIESDCVTVINILKACSSSKTLDEGKLIHAFLIESGFDFDVSTSNSLIDFYSKCGSLKDSCRVFVRLWKRDVVTWSAIIGGYAQQGHSQEALQLFQKMQDEGIEPNEITIICILKAFSNIIVLDWGRLIHTYIIESGFEQDVSIGNILIDMYNTCGGLKDACRVFEHLSKRDVVTWSEMIVGYVEHGLALNVFQLYEEMEKYGIKSDLITFVCLLRASSSTMDLEQGKLIHSKIIETSTGLDAHTENSLIDLYVKCGSLDDAHRVFDISSKQNEVPWNTLIAGCSQQGQVEDAIHLFHQMQAEGFGPDGASYVSLIKACSVTAALDQGKLIHFHSIKSGFESDVFLGSTLIDMYARCGSLEDSCMVFNKLLKRDAVIWSAMISGCAQHGNYNLALQYFEDMQSEGLEPTDDIFVCLLSACSHVGLVYQGYRQFKSMMVDFGIAPNLEHFNCMVDILGRAGYLLEAEDLMQTLPFGPNIVGWRSLLSHCKIHGNADLGRRCFDHIVEIDYREATSYIMMSHIYLISGMQGEVDEIEQRRKRLSAQKKLAKACIEIEHTVHDFIVGAKRQPQGDDVHAKLKRLTVEMKEHGRLPCLDLIVQLSTGEDWVTAFCDT